MRIQKFLSQKNICSRREAEAFIEKGWVYVNDVQVTEKGQKIDPEKDNISLSDNAKKILTKRTYIKYYKPRGIITHSPGSDEQSIHDIIDSKYTHCKPSPYAYVWYSKYLLSYYILRHKYFITI